MSRENSSDDESQKGEFDPFSHPVYRSIQTSRIGEFEARHGSWESSSDDTTTHSNINCNIRQPRAQTRDPSNICFDSNYFGCDSESEDEAAEETERLRRRTEAIDAARLNLRCMRDECMLDPMDVRPMRLTRQKACMYQETVHLPCGSCGAPEETLIRY